MPAKTNAGASQDTDKPDTATPDQNAAQTVEDTKAKADETPDPKTYTATQDVYVGGIYYKAGMPFTTADKAEDFWNEVDTTAAQIDAAALNKVPNDVPLEGLPTAALQAIAWMRHVNWNDMSDEQLITAIKAANEPAL